MKTDAFDHHAADPACDCVFCWCDRLDHERATVADDEDNRGAFEFGPAPSRAPSSKLVPSHENDLKLTEIIGACMGAMTAEGLHALLCEAVLLHQVQSIKDRQPCESCRRAP